MGEQRKEAMAHLLEDNPFDKELDGEEEEAAEGAEEEASDATEEMTTTEKKPPSAGPTPPASAGSSTDVLSMGGPTPPASAGSSSDLLASIDLPLSNSASSADPIGSLSKSSPFNTISELPVDDSAYKAFQKKHNEELVEKNKKSQRPTKLLWLKPKPSSRNSTPLVQKRPLAIRLQTEKMRAPRKKKMPKKVNGDVLPRWSILRPPEKERMSLALRKYLPTHLKPRKPRPS